MPKAMWAFGITWRPSFVVRHLLNFHILIFSSETHQPNELKVSRKHLKSAHFVMIHYQTWPSTGMFLIGQFLKISSSETAWPN
jgi:hypothetical protein